MKKYLIATIAGLMAVTMTMAQEYKVTKSTGKLVISLSSVRVEGYNGTEVVFSNDRGDREVDERARGLQPINGSGLVDNTNLGINVSDKGTTIEVKQVSSKDNKIKIMVPKGMSVSYSYSGVMNSGKASFKNLESELEVSVQHNSVTLENVTGPMTIKAIYGGVDATFKDAIKGPISLVSIYGHVDVSLPVTVKANLSMKTSYGEILAAQDLKIDVERTAGKEDMVSYSNNNVKGKINGGGAELSLRSDYSKIYLRKAN
jgi:predicted membrane protein